MAELLALEKSGRRLGIDKLGERILRMLEGISGQGNERFHFSRDIHPGAHSAAPTVAPSFRGEGHLRGVEEWQLDEVREKAVVRIDPIDDAR